MHQPAQQLELRLDDFERAIGPIEQLVRDRSGWVNVFPKVGDDVVPPRAGIGALFSARGAPLPQGTWVPGQRRPKGDEPSSLGLQHPLGSKAAPVLADLGVVTPPGYRVVADNPRRGLVLEADEPGDPEVVVEWLLRASGGVCPLEFDGWWTAVVHLR